MDREILQTRTKLYRWQAKERRHEVCGYRSGAKMLATTWWAEVQELERQHLGCRAPWLLRWSNKAPLLVSLALPSVKVADVRTTEPLSTYIIQKQMVYASKNFYTCWQTEGLIALAQPGGIKQLLSKANGRSQSLTWTSGLMSSLAVKIRGTKQCIGTLHEHYQMISWAKDEKDTK